MPDHKVDLHQQVEADDRKHEEMKERHVLPVRRIRLRVGHESSSEYVTGCGVNLQQR